VTQHIRYDGGAASLYTARQITTDMCRFSSNLIHCARGLPRVAGIPRGAAQANWDEWLAMGQDRGSVLADPKFDNAAARDYRLQPNSPAPPLGIRPVDLRGAGNHASPERRTWPRPEMEVLREPADYQPATTIELQQPALRTYEDYALGESERGAIGSGSTADTAASPGPTSTAPSWRVNGRCCERCQIAHNSCTQIRGTTAPSWSPMTRAGLRRRPSSILAWNPRDRILVATIGVLVGGVHLDLGTFGYHQFHKATDLDIVSSKPKGLSRRVD
jgi:hypothetical protein